jgi:shikimate kinase
MIISIIGMSNVGKSYWASKLYQYKKFIRYCCDDLIEQKLDPYLKDLGYSGIADVSKWMGQPFEDNYSTNSEIYLQFEREVMLEIFDQVKNMNNTENVVIDTTGSIIYTGQDILDKLAIVSKVIYLQTPQSVKTQMLELYIKEPKPVYWGNIFNKNNHESNLDALTRCYPQLLEYRTKKYAEIAEITLDYFEIRSGKFSLNNFLKRCK